jgi:hypothetical protein
MFYNFDTRGYTPTNSSHCECVSQTLGPVKIHETLSNMFLEFLKLSDTHFVSLEVNVT